MKKIMFALVCAVGCMTAFAVDNVVTNVYDFKTVLKVPYLDRGVRTYKSQTLKGYLYAEYVDSELTNLSLELQNGTTKVIHKTQVNDGFYYLMGKSTRTADRSVPTVYFEAEDVECVQVRNEPHEFIAKIQFAGTGSLKSLKSVTTSCASCSATTVSTEYCNVLYKMNGYATGYMDCQCPDDEDGWWHTVKAVLCGVFYDDDNNVVRQHDAAIWGTWAATFNKKLSDTNLK